MDLQQAFESAVASSRALKNQPGNDVLLRLYALYKQATAGDAPNEGPSGFDFKGIAKYNAWADLRGKASHAAMQEYVALVNDLGEQETKIT